MIIFIKKKHSHYFHTDKIELELKIFIVFVCGNLAGGTNSSKRGKYIFTLSKRTELQRKAKVIVPLAGGTWQVL